MLGTKVVIAGVSKEKLEVGESNLKSEEERGVCSFWRPKALVSKARSGELNIGKLECELRSILVAPQLRSFDPASILVGSSFKLIFSRGIPSSRYRLNSLEWSSGRRNVHLAKERLSKILYMKEKKCYLPSSSSRLARVSKNIV